MSALIMFGSLHHISVALFLLGVFLGCFWRCSRFQIMEMFECFSWVTKVRLCEQRQVGLKKKRICFPWTVCDQKYIWCVLHLTFNYTVCQIIMQMIFSWISGRLLFRKRINYWFSMMHLRSFALTKNISVRIHSAFWTSLSQTKFILFTFDFVQETKRDHQTINVLLKIFSIREKARVEGRRKESKDGWKRSLASIEAFSLSCGVQWL